MARRTIRETLRDGIYNYSRMATARGVANLCSGAWSEPSGLTPTLAHCIDVRVIAGYPAPNGDDALRQAIANFYDDARVSACNITITPGATGALLIAMSISADPGAEIIFPVPAYSITAAAAQLAGLTPRPVPAWAAPANGAGWRLDLDIIEGAVTPATAAIIVVDPDNPTGAVLLESDWNGLIALSIKHGFQLIADRTYEPYAFARPLVAAGALVDRGVFVASSVSKSFHCAGLRIGWLLAPNNVESVLGEAVISYFGGVAALTQTIAAGAIASATRADLQAEQRAAIERRDLLVDRLAQEGVEAWPVEGGLFVNVPAAALGAATADAAWQALLERGLGGVPSSEFLFGADDARPFVRLSFARPASVLLAGQSNPSSNWSITGAHHDT